MRVGDGGYFFVALGHGDGDARYRQSAEFDLPAVLGGSQSEDGQTSCHTVQDTISEIILNSLRNHEDQTLFLARVFPGNPTLCTKICVLLFDSLV